MVETRAAAESVSYCYLSATANDMLGIVALWVVAILAERMAIERMGLAGAFDFVAVVGVAVSVIGAAQIWMLLMLLLLMLVVALMVRFVFVGFECCARCLPPKLFYAEAE